MDHNRNKTAQARKKNIEPFLIIILQFKLIIDLTYICDEDHRHEEDICPL